MKRAVLAPAATRARSSRSLVARSPTADCALAALQVPEAGGKGGWFGAGTRLPPGEADGLAGPTASLGASDVGVVSLSAVRLQALVSKLATKVLVKRTASTRIGEPRPIMPLARKPSTLRCYVRRVRRRVSKWPAIIMPPSHT